MDRRDLIARKVGKYLAKWSLREMSNWEREYLRIYW